jgi:hypothetical protein
MRLTSVKGLGLSMALLCLAGSSACSTGASSDSTATGGSDGIGGNGAGGQTNGRAGASGESNGGGGDPGGGGDGGSSAGAGGSVGGRGGSAGGGNAGGGAGGRGGNAGGGAGGRGGNAGGGGKSAGGGSAGSSVGTGGVAGQSGPIVQFPPGCTCLGMGPPACTPTGHVTYTLAKSASPTTDEQSAYTAITCAMDGAVAYYNCNTAITKQLNVSYVPSVPTADGNINGSIRFGGTQYMECATAMHETAHAVGIGTASNWGTYSVGGVFLGATAIAQLHAIPAHETDTLHSDTQHFWPFGLNQASEAQSPADLVDHCLMVTAIRKDLGLQ